MTEIVSTVGHIAALEACENPEVCIELLREAKDDQLFASLVRLTFDPFKQWQSHSSPDIPDLKSAEAIANADKALCAEWSYFASFLDDRALEHLTDEDLIEFKKSDAWPVYARILAKRFDSELVTHTLVAGELGTIPLWYLGTVVNATMIGYPAGVQPFVKGTRCVAMVSNPCAQDRDVWFVSKTGLPFPVPVPTNVREAILTVDYTGLPRVYHGGLVLDGVVNMAGLTLFDILPLSEFREQKRGESFEERARMLVTLNMPDPVHTTPTIRVDGRDQLIDVVSDLAKKGFERSVVKRLQAPYPYFAAHYGTASWVRAESIIETPAP